MKVPERKWLITFGILSIFLISCLLMTVMYFSHDGKELLTSWPVRTSLDDDAHIEFRKSRPKSWVSLNAISSYAQAAIVLSEDWGFYQHDGFDKEQMKIALEEAASGGRVRGASTITQQMVKNVWLTEDRTLWRKLHEFILAYKVDRDLPKKKILEVYLNVIEFGPKIYGIGNAARHYFGKSPSQITPREGAFLAMLLPSPKKYYVSFRKKRLTKFAKKRVGQILVKMRMGKAITPERYKDELDSKFSWEE